MKKLLLFSFIFITIRGLSHGAGNIVIQSSGPKAGGNVNIQGGGTSVGGGGGGGYNVEPSTVAFILTGGGARISTVTITDVTNASQFLATDSGRHVISRGIAGSDLVAGSTNYLPLTGPLPPSDTGYIQLRNSLQTNSTFFVSSGTVNNQLNVHSVVFSSTNILNDGSQSLDMGNFPIVNIGTAAVPSVSTTSFSKSGSLTLGSSLTINSGMVALSSITYGIAINASQSTQTAANFIVKKSSDANFIFAKPETGSMGFYDDTPVNPGITIATHVYVSGSTPTVSSCGTGPTNSGTDMGGVITVGTGGSAQACTITFTQAFNKIPICFANNPSDVMYLQAAPTTTTLVINATGAFRVNGFLNYLCIGRE